MVGKPFRDSSGRTLEDYPRPSVAVDTAVLTPDPDEGLLVLEVKRKTGSGWALPGTFLHPRETLADAVRRSLRDKAGVNDVVAHQWRVFDDPFRDDRGWVLSVAHWALVGPTVLENRLKAQTRLVPASSPGRLIYDHPAIVQAAVEHVRSRYDASADPERLLPEVFTILQLRKVHETIAGRPLDRDWFRRHTKEKVEATGEMAIGSRGRPAELYRRKPIL
jgi:ADP-ribose pyrophosphatase YjhB (NUDIX family)